MSDTPPRTSSTSDDPYALAQQAADAVRATTGVDTHDIALVMGSGWVPAADILGATTRELPVTDLPGFHAAAVAGHAGTVRSVSVGNSNALVFLGRTHLYEGLGVAAVVHGVRTAVAAGARVVVLTNGCGGLKPTFSPGQPVLISDHINLTATSPIVGPHFETPAEIRMLRALGADLVGMSTALEAIAARAEGVEVLGVSLVTNLAAGMTGEPLNHEEVLAAGRAAATRMGTLLGTVIEGL